MTHATILVHGVGEQDQPPRLIAQLASGADDSKDFTDENTHVMYWSTDDERLFDQRHGHFRREVTQRFCYAGMSAAMRPLAQTAGVFLDRITQFLVLWNVVGLLVVSLLPALLVLHVTGDDHAFHAILVGIMQISAGLLFWSFVCLLIAFRRGGQAFFSTLRRAVLAATFGAVVTPILSVLASVFALTLSLLFLRVVLSLNDPPHIMGLLQLEDNGVQERRVELSTVLIAEIIGVCYPIIAALIFLIIRPFVRLNHAISLFVRMARDAIQYLGDTTWRQQLLYKMQQTRKDVSLKSPVDSLTIVAHSLGSVIAIDYLRTNPGDDAMCTLITGGSPLHRWMYRFFPGHYERPSDLHADLTSAGFRWINIYRTGDPVGGSLDIPGHERSVNQCFGISAHLNYWSDRRVHLAARALLRELSTPTQNTPPSETKPLNQPVSLPAASWCGASIRRTFFVLLVLAGIAAGTIAAARAEMLRTLTPEVVRNWAPHAGIVIVRTSTYPVISEYGADWQEHSEVLAVLDGDPLTITTCAQADWGRIQQMEPVDGGRIIIRQGVSPNGRPEQVNGKGFYCVFLCEPTGRREVVVRNGMAEHSAVGRVINLIFTLVATAILGLCAFLHLFAYVDFIAAPPRWSVSQMCERIWTAMITQLRSLFSGRPHDP